MSGIAGIVHFDSRPVDPGQILAMTAAMDYRGPDGINHWTSGSVALGQCMLRTTPESLEETQPLTNEDASLVLVMDGRIDNWQELRRELLGRSARLRTRADAELLLRAYEAWGERCVEHIDGDFAFALWDARRHALFCACDRVGNRQFHYHWNGSSFAFATDLHPVLNLAWVPESLDQDTLAEYLATDWLTIDTTLWQAVKRLKPANRMTVSGAGKLASVEYWAPDPFAILPCKSDEDYLAYYREMFFDVVRRTLRSHQPLAIEVSGGLDSSSIFAVAMRLQSEGRLIAPAVHGYTLDFRGDPNADEVEYALAVGKHHGVPIHVVPPAYPPLEWYAGIARRFRVFPDFPNGVMNQGIVDQARNAGSRVLVSGTGGDDWTGGSDVSYAENLAAHCWGDVRHKWQEECKALGRIHSSARVLRHGIIPLLPEKAKQFLRAGRDLTIHRGAMRRDWVAPGLRQRLDSNRKNLHAQPSKPTARIGQQHRWRQLYHPYWQFAKGTVERRHAQCGMEWRQPYWDRRMIQFAFSAPDYLFNRPNQNRCLQRDAMQNLLPESVRLRQDKAEFSSTFKRHWPELSRLLSAEILPRRGDWAQPDGVRALMALAFTPDSVRWDSGPPWILFGLDACCPP